MLPTSVSLGVAGTLVLSSTALGIVEVIFSDIAGQPTAVVPAGSGLPANAEFELFDRPFRSPDGTRVIFQAQAAPPVPDTEDRIVMVFDGTNWATVLREGQAAPWAPAETMGFFDAANGINNSGQFAISNDTSGPTATDLYVVRYNGTTYDIIAQEGSPIPAGGGNYAATQDGIHILNDGTVGFYTTASAGGSRCMIGDTALAQVGVDSPSGQAGGATELYDAITGAAYMHDGSGASYILRASLAGATTTDDVIVVNGAVVIQEGIVLPGSGFTEVVRASLTSSFVNMMSNGDWFARCSNEPATNNTDWVVRNGDLIAVTDEPITPGNTELYDDAIFATTFFWQHGNNNGDWVVGGVTNAADVNANAVLVLNGETVVARENDPVDLNGNGLPDDDAFISVFNNDDGFLTDDLFLYFTADLRNAAGTALGQAFLRLDLNPKSDCPADIAPSGGDGEVNIDDLLAVIGAWGPCADPNNCPADIAPKGGDDEVNIDDLLAVIGAWGPCP